ncbi:MAG TPA: hypothetical protein VIW93_03730 [Candidatus Acidoferrum sp.]
MRKIVLGIITVTIAGLLSHEPVHAQAKEEAAQAKPASQRPEGFKPELQASHAYENRRNPANHMSPHD